MSSSSSSSSSTSTSFRARFLGVFLALRFGASESSLAEPISAYLGAAAAAVLPDLRVPAIVVEWRGVESREERLGMLRCEDGPLPSLCRGPLAPEYLHLLTPSSRRDLLPVKAIS